MWNFPTPSVAHALLRTQSYQRKNPVKGVHTSVNAARTSAYATLSLSVRRNFGPYLALSQADPDSGTNRCIHWLFHNLAARVRNNRVTALQDFKRAQLRQVGGQ